MPAQTQDWADRALAELKAQKPKQAPSATPLLDSMRDQSGPLAADVMAADEREDRWSHQALAELKSIPKPSLGEKALAFGQGAVAGVAGAGKAIFSDLPHEAALAGTGLLADALGRERPDETSFERSGAIDPASAIGRGADAVQQAVTPDNPMLAEGAPFNGGEMVGQVVPMLAATLLGAPLAGGVGAAQMMGPMMGDARTAGASPLETLATGAMAGTVGAAGIGVAGTVLENLSARGGGALLRSLSGAARELETGPQRILAEGAARTAVGAGEGVAAGAAGGVAFTALTNAIHNWATDDEIPLLQGAEANAILGGALGGLIRGATEAALAKRQWSGRKFTGEGWDGAMLPEDAPREGDPAAAEGLREQGQQAAGVRQEADAAARAEAERRAAEARARAESEARARAQEEERRQYQQRAREEQQRRKAGAKAEPPPPPEPPPVSQRQKAARGLIEKDRAELAKMLKSRREREEADVRAQHPGRSEEWYRHVDELRATARDPSLEGAAAAGEELHSLGIKPLAPDPFTTEDVLDAYRARLRATVAGHEAAGQSSATFNREQARTKAERDVTRKARANAGTGPVYEPAGAPGVMGAPVGRKLEGTTDNTLPPGVKPVAKQAVLEKFLDVLRAAGSTSPMLQGGVPEWALGTFSPLTNVVRGTKWGDLATASHEVFHALERAVFGWTGHTSPWDGSRAARNGVGALMQGELYRLGKKLYGNVTPAGGYLREGWAEYGRHWLTDPDSLMTVAPNTTRWFESQFLADPKLANVKPALQTARNHATVWRLQGAENRALMQTHQPMAVSSRMERIAKVVRYATSAQAWFRGESAFVAFEKEIERRMGRKLLPSERVVEAADNVRRQAEGALMTLVDSHTGLDDGVTVTGMSLRQAIAPAQGHEREFHLYAWARRALVLLDLRDPIVPGVSRATPRDPGMSAADAQFIVERVERDLPQVAQAVENYYDWNDRVVEFIASVEPEMGRRLRELGSSREMAYAPLRRKVDDLEAVQTMRPSGGAKARKAEVAVPLSGSGRPVKDILPEVLDQTRARLEMAYRRVPLLRMIELAEQHPEWASFYLRPANEEVRRLTASAIADAQKPLIDRGDVSDQSHDAIGSAMSLFSKPYVPAGGRDPVLMVWRNGAMQTWEINRDVYKGLTNLNAPRFTKLWHLLLTVPKNLVVQGSTVLRPAFGFVLNPMVDLPTFLINTKYYANPAEALGHWMKYSIYALLDGASAGHFHEVVKDPFYDTYKKLNLEYGQSYNVNAGRADITAKRLLQSTARRALSPNNVIDYVAKLLSSTEKAGRIAEMRGALKEIGWDGKRALLSEEVQQARVAAKQVTIDFTQAGDIARMVNQAIPFFNSPLQGGAAFYRAAKDHPMRFAAAMTGALGLGIANWMQNRDEDWYKEMPLDERARYWHVRVNWNGRDEILRWKKPQEIAAIDSIITELSDAVYRNRPARTHDLLETVSDLGPMPTITNPFFGKPQLPVLPQIGVEMLTNTDLRLGRPIVPDSLANLPPEEQKGEFTTQAAAAIGRWTNTSPMKVDHFIRSLMGRAPRDVMDSLGLGAGLNDREKTASDEAILGAAFRRGGMYNAQAQAFQDFYRLVDLADGRSKSTEHPESMEEARIRGMLRDAGAALAAMGHVRAAYLKTSKERDQALQEMVRLARRAADCAAAGKWDPVSFEAERQVQSLKSNLRDLGAGVLPKAMRTP